MPDIKTLLAEIRAGLDARSVLIEDMITRSGLEAILDHVMALEDENARLREALEYYSSPRDYISPLTGVIQGEGKLYFDCGNRARAALGGSNG